MARSTSRAAPISVVIPTLNAGETLARCLSSLAPAALDGLIREVVVSDAGSTDATRDIADAFGARLVTGAKGRGAQLRFGAEAAHGEWLLFIHADTRLEASWPSAIGRVLSDGPRRAGVFTLAFDDRRAAAAIVAWGAKIRSRLFASPYGDQGLLLHREAYDAIGGYNAMPLFEDVDIVDRFVRAYGRDALVFLPARAMTSADRYRRDGYARRVLRNFICMTLYRFGVAPAKILALYEASLLKR